MRKGGRRPGLGRPKGSGLYGELGTMPYRVPLPMVEAFRMWREFYKATKCILTAARLLVAQLETNEKNE